MDRQVSVNHYGQTRTLTMTSGCVPLDRDMIDFVVDKVNERFCGCVLMVVLTQVDSKYLNSDVPPTSCTRHQLAHSISVKILSSSKPPERPYSIKRDALTS